MGNIESAAKPSELSISRSALRIETGVEVKGRVLVVGNFLSATLGARGVCEEFSERLLAGRWTTITTSHKPGRMMRLLDMLGTVWRRRHEYSVAHVDVFSGSAFLWAEAVGRALHQINKPYILTLRGGNLPDFARRHSARVRHLFSAAAAVTAPSRYLLEEMKPYRDDLILLPNPLDLSAYVFKERAQPEPRLVWLRAFHETYNPSLAPKVMASLTTDFPDICLVMVGRDKGDGSLQRMRQVAGALGVMHRITLPGGVQKEKVSEWMNEGDIFLNTTNFDNTPVSVLEAMACGLCVVSTNVGGIPYLLEHEEDALLVPPDNAQAMGEAVRRLLCEPALAKKISRNARRKAERFDWSLALPQWEELLARVTEEA